MTPTAPQAATSRPSPWALARWSALSCFGLTFAILLTVLLAACGGDDDAATTTTTLPFETTTTFPVDDDDQAVADHARAACSRFDTDGTDDATADEVVATLVEAGALGGENTALFIVAFTSECPEHLVPLGEAQARAGLGG